MNKKEMLIRKKQDAEKKERLEKAMNFISMFPVFSGEYALKIGIHKDLREINKALNTGISNLDLRRAISRFVSSDKYNIKVGDDRFDIHLNKCGKVEKIKPLDISE